MRMLLRFNVDNLQLPKMVITEDMHKDYCKFMNVLKTLVYEFLFQKRLPRVLPEVKILLLSSLERILRDWFLSEDNTGLLASHMSYRCF